LVLALRVEALVLALVKALRVDALVLALRVDTLVLRFLLQLHHCNSHVLSEYLGNPRGKNPEQKVPD